MKGKNVLLFLWRSLSNSLPTMCNLSRHGVPIEAVCLICRTSNETVTHVLWTCVIANGARLSVLN